MTFLPPGSLVIHLNESSSDESSDILDDLPTDAATQEMVDAFLASVRNKIKVQDSRMRTLRPDEVASVKKIRKRISVLQEKILKAQAAMKRTKRALQFGTEKKRSEEHKSE